MTGFDARVTRSFMILFDDPRTSIHNIHFLHRLLLFGISLLGVFPSPVLSNSYPMDAPPEP